jgi:hypothetical protein
MADLPLRGILLKIASATMFMALATCNEMVKKCQTK